MKKTKYVALLLSIFFVFSLISPAIANQEPPKNEVHMNTLGNLTYQDSTQEIYSVTDKKILEELIKSDNIEVPEGYELTSIKTTVLYTEPATDFVNEVLEDDVVTPMSSYWVKWIDNVRTVGDRYYGDLPLYSDWFDGPLPEGFEYSLNDVVNSSFTTKFGFKASEISAEVGFNVSTGHEISRKFRTDAVASGKRLNVKIFTNYSVREFRENRYLQSGGIKLPTETEVGTAWRPVGYIIKQYHYSN